ncbi:MAG: response regulator [Eubacteriales bacterium]|nr:response regulator [Eubacteriales bacterium]
MRFLVADDDFVNRKFLEKVLSDYGEVTVIDNGMTAVETAITHIEKREQFDVICLDVMMTKLDGYKSLEAIREAEAKYEIAKENRAKIIMISALDEDLSNKLQVCDDYDAYICKPILIEDIDKILQDFGFSK